MNHKLLFISPLALIYPAQAFGIVKLEQSISLWNLGGALVLIGAGWMALKGRIHALEEEAAKGQSQREEVLQMSHKNQTKLVTLKSEIFERLMDQERLLFEKVDERFTRLEAKIDRLIEKGNGR